MRLLSRKEELILLAVWTLKDNAYGVTIREEIQREVEDANLQIALSEAKKIDEDYEVGEEVTDEVKLNDLSVSKSHFNIPINPFSMNNSINS